MSSLQIISLRFFLSWSSFILHHTQLKALLPRLITAYCTFDPVPAQMSTDENFAPI